MIGWLIYSKEDATKNEAYIGFYMEEGKNKGIEIRLIYREDIRFGVFEGKHDLKYQGKMIPLPDFVICRTIYPLLSRQLELFNIPVFNNATVAEICNDKAKTYQYVAQTEIPMISTSFVKNYELKEYLMNIQEPSVIKAVDGHGGSQVMLLDQADLSEVDVMEDIIYRMKGSDVVIQPLTGKKCMDLRVYVIGTNVIAAILRKAKTGFRSNYSLGGHVEVYKLSENELEIVNRVIGLFDFGLVGIDFLIGDEGELIFNEIEDVVGARMLYSCCDINLVDLYLEYIINRIRKKRK
ncbi:MAG: RimK family alpha-L-glutamate ligase [Anaerocolumna sp.]